MVYLHSDHLGSISAVTNEAGQKVGEQEFDPWGKVRPVTGSGQTTQQSKHNYTGQRLDDTGLLFYNARYYDPGVGRFTSPDSIVPGNSFGAGGALGTVGTWQNSRLTVDFHERGFLSSVQGENALTLEKGFWFQLSGQDKGKADPSGPVNPQALNRYSYVLNNPVRYTDPTGHSWYLNHDEAKEVAKVLRAFAAELYNFATGMGIVDLLVQGFDRIINNAKLPPEVKQLLKGLGGTIVRAFSVAGFWAIAIGAFAAWNLGNSMTALAQSIEDYNGPAGVAIGTLADRIYIMNRETGAHISWSLGPLLRNNLPADLRFGVVAGGEGAKDWQAHWHFIADHNYRGPGVCQAPCIRHGPHRPH